jgi:hypothetical protein
VLVVLELAVMLEVTLVLVLFFLLLAQLVEAAVEERSAAIVAVRAALAAGLVTQVQAVLEQQVKVTMVV